MITTIFKAKARSHRQLLARSGSNAGICKLGEKGGSEFPPLLMALRCSTFISTFRTSLTVDLRHASSESRETLKTKGAETSALSSRDVLTTVQPDVRFNAFLLGA